MKIIIHDAHDLMAADIKGIVKDSFSWAVCAKLGDLCGFCRDGIFYSVSRGKHSVTIRLNADHNPKLEIK